MKANIKCCLLLGWFCGYTLLLFAQPNITRVEYYVNIDPGYGLATNVPITAGKNLPLVSFNLNISNYPIGLTLVGARSKDANGAWSHDNRWLIAKLPQQTIKPDITRAEYYVNTDPGYGKGTPIVLSPAVSDGSGSFTIDITNQPIGLTMVGCRTRDANGAWSHDNRWLIAKLPVENPSRPIKKVEYYIDTDPGYGKATAIATAVATNLPNRQVNVNISGLSSGKHYIFYRSQDSVGAWSHDNVDSFTLASSQPAPVLVVNSVNKNTFCANDSIKIGFDATGTYTAGNAFKVYLSDANGSFANEVEIGTNITTTDGIVAGKLPFHLPEGTGYKLRVKSSAPALTGEAGGNKLTIHDRPVAQTITGLSSANGNETWPYTVPPATNSSWNWLVTNGSKTIGGATNNVSIQWAAGNTGAIKPAQIKVIETNQFGCVGDTSLLAVNIYKLRIGNSLSTTTPCLKDSVTIALNTDGLFYTTPSANQFIAELSNASGVFTTPVATATITSPAITGNNQTPGNIKIAIPGNLPNGTNYRIRVRSTNPVFIGDTSIAISIQKPNLGADLTNSKCTGFGYDLRSNFTDAALSYTYFSNSFVLLTRPDSVDTGVYQVIGTNTFGCTDTAKVTITHYLKPNLGVDITRSKCLGFTYSLAGVYTDVNLTYAYFTNAYATVPNAAALNDGVYNIVATTANGCKDTAQVTVTNYPKPNLGADITRSTCLGFGYNLTTIYTDPALTYAYFTQAFASVSTPSSAGTGLYNIVATNSNGCKDTAQVTVNNFIKPNIGADITGFKCAGLGYSLATNYSNAALTYNFYTQGFAQVGNPSAIDIGVYNVVATNSDGCKDTAIITVTNFAKPNLGADITKSKCLGFTYDLSTVYNTAGLTYDYFTKAYASIANPITVETGVYNIIATNSDGCKDTAQVTVTNFAKPNLGADIIRSKCIGFTYDLTTVYNTAGLTYSYFMGNFSVVNNPAFVIDGVHNIVATNSSGCKDTAQVTVTSYTKPNLGADIITNTCVGFGYNLTSLYTDVALAYSYFTQAFASVSKPSSVSSGLYNIVATNSNSCKDTAQVTVNNFIKPNLGPDITGSKCAGFGYNIAANYENAALSYNFYTQGFAQVGNPTAVDMGVYNVVATNSDGCKDTAIITVTNFAKPNLGADITKSKCVGFTYDLSSVYNTSGLTYSYYTQAFAVIANPAAVEMGVYNIIATNADGCKDTVLVSVTNSVKPNVGADTTLYHVCAGETTNLVPLYNTTGLTVNWNTLNTTAAPPGVYRLIVANTSGCTDTAFATVILDVAFWTGAVSNDWHTASNWSTNKIPTAQTHVIIPAGKPNQCAINSADAEAASVQVKIGAALQLSANRKLLVTQKCTLLPAN